ncbi:hypothetical protein PROFUN_02381 [Planoprotostelium fungivorum]|uniref:Deacetylase sirtuin-type domain-containing protein n=1 Tax=Planoprotostelium fungivorum TaxID=1890364 RepID=A0A2P6NUP2_9EUKA|nr:hypothetical protein PROFUN_02381 [Planoprotostelium fungivorum]
MEQKTEKKEDDVIVKNEATDAVTSGNEKESATTEEHVLVELLSSVSIQSKPPTTPKSKPLSEPTIEEVAKGITDGTFKKIIVMTGAGISVAAGIPDFRTPGTGLYYNLQKYDLPFPEAVFEIRYFQQRPEPFYALAKEMWPSNYKPTITHHFIRLLEEKGVLLRNYTQNIDTLERQAGISPELLVEAHGSFGTTRCIKCKREVDQEWLREKVFRDEIPKCSDCEGLIKPDITFFGENLPERFHTLTHPDFQQCDLLFVIGTSLEVYPFASLVDRPKSDVPRVLINMEEVGPFESTKKDDCRDVKVLGDCQASVRELAKLLHWESELDELVHQGEVKFKSRRQMSRVEDSHEKNATLSEVIHSASTILGNSVPFGAVEAGQTESNIESAVSDYENKKPEH